MLFFLIIGLGSLYAFILETIYIDVFMKDRDTQFDIGEKKGR